MEVLIVDLATSLIECKFNRNGACLMLVIFVELFKDMSNNIPIIIRSDNSEVLMNEIFSKYTPRMDSILWNSVRVPDYYIIAGCAKRLMEGFREDILSKDINRLNLSIEELNQSMEIIRMIGN